MEESIKDQFLRTYRRESSFLDSIKQKAVLGDENAMYQLGLCYYYGNYGVPKNNKTAFDWFIKAANLGHMIAQYYTGYCFEKSIGVPRNAVQRAKYYGLAAQQGFMNAQYEMGYLYEYGIGIEKDEKKLRKCFN